MPETTDPRQLAAAKRRAREQRIRELRTRVVALAVALFVAVWSGLYIQLVSGHDPALAAEATPVTQSGAADDGSDDSWSEDAVTGDASTDTWSDSADSEPAAVTTAQS